MRALVRRIDHVQDYDQAQKHVQQLRGELGKLQQERDAKVKKGVKPSQSDELALQRCALCIACVALPCCV